MPSADLAKYNVISTQILSMRHQGVLSDVLEDHLINEASELWKVLTDEERTIAKDTVASWRLNHPD